jgi:hypothetical protein
MDSDLWLLLVWMVMLSWGVQGFVLIGPPAANTGKFTVRAVAEIITLWPR